MFFDDLNGLVFSVGNLKSYVGYLSSNSPCFLSDSYYAIDVNQKNFFENLKLGLSSSTEIKSLLEDDRIQNIDEYVNFLEKMSFKIGAEFQEQPLMIVNKLNENLEQERKQMSKILFESKNTPCLYYVEEAVSQLFSSGAFTGLTVNCGANSTWIKPIFEGYLVKKQSRKLSLGGEHFTKQLKNIIEQKLGQEIVPYYNLKQVKQNQQDDTFEKRFQNLQKDVQQSVKDFFTLRIVRDIKEPLLQNFQAVFEQTEDNNNSNTTKARLPDDTLVEIQQNEIKQMEQFIFDKKQNFKDSIELPQQIINCIMDCDSDMKRELLNKIYLSGGNSLIKNFKENVESNLSTLQTMNAKIKVHGSNKILNRKMGSWLGASILGSTASFQNMWVSKFEYEEAGENIIIRKCLNQQQKILIQIFNDLFFVIMKFMKIFLVFLSLQILKNESVRVPSPFNACFGQLNKAFDTSFMDKEMMNLDGIKIITNTEKNLDDIDKKEGYMFESNFIEEDEDKKLKFRVSDKDLELKQVSSSMYENGDISTDLSIKDESFTNKEQVQQKLDTIQQEKNDLQQKQKEENGKYLDIGGELFKAKTQIKQIDNDINLNQQKTEGLEQEQEETKVDKSEDIQKQVEELNQLLQKKQEAEDKLDQKQDEYNAQKEALDNVIEQLQEKSKEVNDYQAIIKYLNVSQDKFQYCYILQDTDYQCDPQYSDLIMTEIPQTIQEFQVNTAQDAMRGVLSRLQLTTGKLFPWNNIKFKFDNHLSKSVEDRNNIKLDKGFLPLSYALKSLTDSVSTNKGDILNNLMLTSIIFKKVLVLVETTSGIRSFQCPSGTDNDSNENINEKQNNMDHLFIENIIDFDFITKRQLEYELYIRDIVNRDKIITIQQDLQKGNSNETYNPNFELKNIMSHQESALPKSEIHDFHEPLYKFDRHVPNDDKTLACSSGMIRDFPLLVPFLNEDMLGFQLKEQGGSQNFEFIYFYDKFIVRRNRETKKFVIRRQQLYEQDLKSENFIQNMFEFYQENELINKIPTLIERILQFMKKVFDKIVDVFKSLFGFKKKKQEEVAEVVEENDDITKTIEDIAIKANINYHFKNFEFDGETYSDNFNFFEELDAKRVIDLMINQREIIDNVIENYIIERKKRIEESYEKLNENKQEDEPPIKYVYQFEFDVYRIEALIKINQFRLMTYLFRRLKFSPTVLPESFDLLQQKDYKNLYQQHDEKLQEQAEGEQKNEPPNKIDTIIQRDKISRDKIDNTFNRAIEMTENLSQDKGNRFKSKKHLVYSSFVHFMQKFFKKNFDDNADLAACLVPHENMQRGNKCPLFLKDFIKYLSENPNNKIDFNSIYNLFFDYFETNPETLQISVNQFIDQMFNFSRFFRTKEFFQMGELPVVKIIKDKILELTLDEDIVGKLRILKIQDEFSEKQYRQLVYATTLEDIGLVYPEFKYTSLQFLFTMLDTVIDYEENTKQQDFKKQLKEQKIKNEREFQKLKNELENFKQQLEGHNKILI